MPAQPPVFVSYLRVSTAKQGAKGLGIEAQRATVEAFARQEGVSIAAEYVEVETGKGHDALERRPQLAAALAHARRLKAPAVVAKPCCLGRTDELRYAVPQPPDGNAAYPFVAVAPYAQQSPAAPSSRRPRPASPPRTQPTATRSSPTPALFGDNLIAQYDQSNIGLQDRIG